MGNNQSNERKRNYKICKIIRVDKHSEWCRCYLDDYVPYNNGSYKYMDFEEYSDTRHFFSLVSAGLGGSGIAPSAALSEGWYIAIDTDMTKEHNSKHNFGRNSVRNVYEVSSSELPGAGGFRGNIEEITAMREMRARLNEWTDFDKRQQAWQLEPPKK